MRHAESRGSEMNIEIRTWNTKTVLWSGEAMNMADGVQQAVRAGVSLAYANLAGVNLADANLVDANLVGARLDGASLVGADLADANLVDASIAYARIDEPICRMDFGGWSICIRANETTIGCKRRANSEWLEWTSESEEIVAMHADAPAWWAVHGDAVKAVIKCVMRKAHEVTK
jgi:hypothetical protein